MRFKIHYIHSNTIRYVSTRFEYYDISKLFYKVYWGDSNKIYSFEQASVLNWIRDNESEIEWDDAIFSKVQDDEWEWAKIK